MQVRREVVVTGLGAVTPLGGDVASTWEGLLNGRSGITVLDDPRFEDFPVRLAAPAAVDPAELMPRAEARRVDRTQQFALVAAREAWRDSGLAQLAGTERAVPGERLGVSVGSCLSGASSLFETWDMLREKGPRYVSPFTAGRILPDASASWIGLDIGAKAVVETPEAACATGNDALRRGAELVRSGKADVVVAGGTDAMVHPFVISAFISMRALSRRNDEPELAARPFTRTREGFVIGEGAAVMVLESAEHAAARGARMYARLAGVGYSSDSHDFAQPDPTGAGQAAAIREAMADAGLEPGQIAHVNAHAASTPQGDLTESIAIRSVLGAHTDDVVVTAPKSSMGHLMAGAGAAESMAAVLALYHRVVPPTLNQDDYDEEIALDVAQKPRHLPEEGELAALSNSFGLGGRNVVLAFRTA
ncbi:beta-ketoacyl-[acyl-carrier-protein] synthase family protein [Streptomyces tuirus]|uniref:Beta-ketoacyl-[acyl-carrier-protein] synthase family protein n=1 Tax=Streptomyces tuirus TaxID=68278 RepID=A0A941F8G6_9ACTN|nr:beta-ketoacyl-[acyl-carrier-protein] synthase family protein [Streptomyces tuirus]